MIFKSSKWKTKNFPGKQHLYVKSDNFDTDVFYSISQTKTLALCLQFSFLIWRSEVNTSLVEPCSPFLLNQCDTVICSWLREHETKHSCH